MGLHGLYQGNLYLYLLPLLLLSRWETGCYQPEQARHTASILCSGWLDDSQASLLKSAASSDLNMIHLALFFKDAVFFSFSTHLSVEFDTRIHKFFTQQNLFILCGNYGI
jgi:hypothetical protein